MNYFIYGFILKIKIDIGNNDFNTKLTYSPTILKKGVQSFATPSSLSVNRTHSVSFQSNGSSESPFRLYKECIENPSVSLTRRYQLHNLFILFICFASYGTHYSLSMLCFSNFIKMLKSAEIYNEATYNDFCLIFRKAAKNKNKLTFTEFLNTLISIGNIVFKKKDPREGLDSLIGEYLDPLLEKEMENIKMICLPDIPKEIPNEPAIVQSMEQAFTKIYAYYYPFEKNKILEESQMLDLSINATFQFMSDFEICPGIITRPIAFYLLHLIINKTTDLNLGTPSIGRAFTYSKFIELIVRISIHSKLCGSYLFTGILLTRWSNYSARDNEKYKWL